MAKRLSGKALIKDLRAQLALAINNGANGIRAAREQRDQAEGKAEQLQRQLTALRENSRATEKLLQKETTLPPQSRRVERRCIFEGDPKWVAEQLQQSLAPGRNVVGSQPEGKQINTITILPVSDETVQVQMRVAPQQTRVFNTRNVGGAEVT